MKYRTDITVTEIAETLVSEAQQIDNLLKARLGTYNQAKAAVAAVERKNTGSLLTKDLGPYLKAEDFTVSGSEFMTTLLVVIPKLLKSQWESTYEHLAEMVVPRSSKRLSEEGEYVLYNVTVFNKVKDDFIKAATDQKFTVREYAYDEGRLRETEKADEIMMGDMKAQWAALVRLLKTNFGELFSAWIHLKVARLFVESVLQYGLPPQFLALLLKPTVSKDMEKSEKKLRLALLQHLEQLQLPGISPVDIATALHSASAEIAETEEEAELWSALNMANRDQEPFVKITLKWNVPS
jgi:V-type H+-transporting ATPase subunit C